MDMSGFGMAVVTVIFVVICLMFRSDGKTPKHKVTIGEQRPSNRCMHE